nr:hypothetical protein [Bacteroides acidifaciens]
MASANRRNRRANGMKGSTVCKALESGTPLNSLYALIPENRHAALDRFLRLFGKSTDDLRKALERERS